MSELSGNSLSNQFTLLNCATQCFREGGREGDFYGQGAGGHLSCLWQHEKKESFRKSCTGMLGAYFISCECITRNWLQLGIYLQLWAADLQHWATAFATDKITPIKFLALAPAASILTHSPLAPWAIFADLTSVLPSRYCASSGLNENHSVHACWSCTTVQTFSSWSNLFRQIHCPIRSRRLPKKMCILIHSLKLNSAGVIMELN